MFSYIASVFSYLFSSNDDIEEEHSKEEFLAQQLLNLEYSENSYALDEDQNTLNTEAQQHTCFEKTGVITFLGDDFVLIDGSFFFDTSNCTIPMKLNDQVCFLGYETSDGALKVSRILNNLGTLWGDEAEEFKKFEVIERVIIGEVDYREDRNVFIKESDLCFSLDEVEASIVPVKGDWLELTCSMQFDKTKPSESSTSKVLQVISLKPLRAKVANAEVTSWNGNEGTCDKIYFFTKSCVENGCVPQVGDKVILEAIESNQGLCTWRALKIIIESNITKKTETTKNDIEKRSEEQISLELESQKGIEITYPLEFKGISMRDNPVIDLIITNKSDQTQTLNKWIIIGRKRDSQISIQPFLNQPLKIYPNKNYSFRVTCKPKLLGSTREHLVFSFRGFQLTRFIQIDIQGDNFEYQEVDGFSRHNSEAKALQIMKQVRHNTTEGSFVPGVRPVKPPAFIPVRIGAFPIPNKVWSAVLGDSNETIQGGDYGYILDRMESILPCLISDLTINNYNDKWHTLLFMEEIQQNLSMRFYDMSKTYLSHRGEFLGLEIAGLSERRPSLIAGDRVMVKDIWDPNGDKYEGYIHEIRGDLVLLKFNPQFQEMYAGSDVSVEFHFSRTIYRRCHQAVNLAIANLGPDLLFPSKLLTRKPQIDPAKLQNIRWFNKSLNEGQKSAVTNILLGECRPMPYFIFGPPGTGKTITVIETILQILTLIPHSRVLVATPSNSAANLVTERLLNYKHVFSHSIIRLIAYHLLDSDTLPDIIKPFCATIDIAAENTSESKYTVRKDGINLHCQKSFIGRHRVSIGTCLCIGSLAQAGLPKGHFTHIIVDEAGQATEPEIMIPITFTDKQHGQIILAGDPMQLGPTVMSKYTKEYGMDESYMSRILERFPYQKDFDAFKEGYDPRLVTKLNENYRSLREILTLPSQFFYDGSLVPMLVRNTPWIEAKLNTLAQLFETDKNTGGYFVFGVRGVNCRGEDSPSWYNPQEAAMVALTTCKLYKNGIVPNEIGIITPYIAQIKHLRKVFDAMGLEQPKIGSVEEFQGQERQIILISTVRSTDSHLSDDLRFTLGFVQHPKRLNVAITRAQVAVLLFCNPHLLSKDNLWKQIIQQAVKDDKYSGCDLPKELS